MGDINRRDPDVLAGVPKLSSLTALSAHHKIEENVALVDARPEKEHNLGYIAGSFAVPFSNNFATWVGWVVPWGQPLIFMAAEPSQQEDMVRQLIRIGYDRLDGFVDGGIEGWRSAGLPVEISGRMEIDALNALWSQPAAPMIIDVRQRAEFHAGHIPGALNIELGELQDHLDGLPREIPIVTVCAAGMRATIAGSILDRDGRKNIQVVDEHGTPAWIERGYPSATGEE
jgi:rhodanese-related sulfurtransferase